jgi:uncharacterized protein (TIGR02145 family)
MKRFLLVMLAIFFALPTLAFDIPTVPLLLTPSNNQTNYDDGLLIWKNSTDSNGQGIVYDLYLGTTSNPSLYQAQIFDGYTDDKMLAFIDGETFNVYLFNPLTGNQTYYWKVVARSADNTQTHSIVQNFKTSNTNHFPPTEPVNPSPSLGAQNVSHQTLFEWSASTDSDGDAVVYHIYLDTVSNPKKLLASNLSASRFKPTVPLKGNRKYYWKTVADDGKGRQTESGIWNFTTANYLPSIPSLKSPTEGAAGISYTSALEWFPANDPDGDLSHYEIWYGTDASLGYSTRTQSTHVYIPLNAGSSYFWKVVAVDKQGARSESVTRSFATAAVVNIPPAIPVLSVPVNNAASVSTEVVLRWFRSADLNGHPVNYTLFVGENPTQLKQYTSLADSSYTLSNLQPGKTYYWKVFASDGHGGVVSSQTFSFTTTTDYTGISQVKAYYRFAHSTMLHQFIESPLTPSFHADTARYETSGKTTMNDAAALAFYYTNPATSISFELPPLFSVTSNITYNYGLPTNANAIYQIEGDFSVHNKVTVVLTAGDAVKRYTIDLRVNQLPDKPILQSPSPNEVDVDIMPVFTWSGGEDPERQTTIYRIYLGTEVNNLIQIGLVSGTKMFQYRAKPLLSGVKYYWKVVAQDAANETRESDVSAFVTKKAGTVRTIPELLFPRTISTYVDLMVDLRWNNITTGYVSSDIYLDVKPEPSVWQKQVTGNHFTLPNLAPNTTYYWKVVNHLQDGSSVESEIRKFKTKPASGNVTGIFTDSRDGQHYQWVQVGGMQWMVHNLAYQPEQGDGFAGYTYNDISSGNKTYFILDHTIENFQKYGYLYNAAGATNNTFGSEPMQGVCPTGWRLPTRQEWMNAFYSMGGISGDEIVGNNTIDFDAWSIAGKESLWENIQGLSILPAGGMTGGVVNRTFWSQFWVQDTTSERMQYVQYYYNQANKKLTITEAEDYLNSSGAYIRCVRSLNGVAPSVTLTAPADNATLNDYTATLNWLPANDPEQDLLTYRVYIDTAHNPVRIAADTLTKTSVVIGGLPQNAKYYWKVIAIDAAGNIAASEVWSFSTKANTSNASPDVPALLLPASDQSAVALQPVFQWSSMQDPNGDPVKADLYLGLDSLTWSPVARGLNNNMYVLGKKLKSKTKYFWRIKVYDEKGGIAYSKVSTFETGNQSPSAPQLLTPANGALHILNNHTLSWAFATDPEGDHVTYTVRIGQLPSSMQDAATNLSGNTYAFGSLSTPLNTDFYWQVIATDRNGASTPSEIRSFKTYRYHDVNGTVLNSPADRATGVSLTPTLSWNTGPYTNGRYDVYIQKDNGLMLVAANVNATTYSVNQLLGKSSLEPHTTYSWQVVGKDASGIGNSAPSAVWSFTTTSEPPSKPVLELPTNHAVNQPYSVLLQWKMSMGLEGDYIFYDVYLRQEGGTVTKIAADLLTTYFQLPDLMLTPEKKYYWYIIAKNMFNGQAISDTWDFTVKDNTVNTAPTQPQLKAPVNYEQGVSVAPVFAWQASQDVDGDAVNYSIYIGKDPAAMTSLVSGLTQPSYTVTTSLIPHTRYYWMVKATDNKSQTSSQTGVFVTVNATPDKVTLISPQQQQQLTNDNVVVTWSASSDADHDAIKYDIYLGTDATTLEKVAANIDVTQYELKNLVNNKTYHWQVVAHDSFGGETKSDIQQFVSKNDAPRSVILKTPIDESIVKGPAVTLRWEPAVDPEGGNIVYDVYIGSDAISSSRVATVPEATAFVFNSAADGADYIWYIVARDAWGGETSSEIWDFTSQYGGANQPPSQVQLVSPVNNAQHVQDPVTVSWTASEDPEEEDIYYNIYFGTDPNSLPLVGEKVSALTASVGDALQGNTIYYWNVEAVDAAGNKAVSQTWSFTSVEKFEIAGEIRNVKGDLLSGTIVMIGEKTVRTNNEGRYSIEEVSGWSGAITPVSSNYRFVPLSIEIQNLQASRVDNHFTALRSGYVAIQGKITDESGKGIEGVSFLGAEDIVTNVSGNYILEVPTGWSGSIAPVSTMYKFLPDEASFVHLTSDKFSVDFTGVIVLNTFLPEQGHTKVYPNPTQGAVTFIWAHPLPSEGILTMINTSGQEVLRLPVASGSKYRHVNLEAFPDGLYQCSLYSSSGVVVTYRVIIDK